jgi:hypothetical protein
MCMPIFKDKTEENIFSGHLILKLESQLHFISLFCWKIEDPFSAYTTSQLDIVTGPLNTQCSISNTVLTEIIY